MTYSGARAVGEARGDVGFQEYGANGNPYSLWQYGVEYPPGGWCMSAASKWAYDAGFRFGRGATHGDKGFSHTDAARAWAQSNGLWRDKWWHAEPGDLIIFDWGSGGPTDHVEQNVTDQGSQLLLIGGNTGDAVAYRTRDRRYVVGIVALSQSPQAIQPVDPDVLIALKRLDDWRKRCHAEPLERGMTKHDVAILHDLFVAKGLLAKLPRRSNTFTLATANANAHLKRIAGLEGGGNKFGGAAADALLKRRSV